MKTYNLLFNKNVDPYLKMDITNCIESKFGFKESNKSDVTYYIVTNENLIKIYKKTQLTPYIELTIKNMLWDNIIHYLPKNKSTCLIPSSINYMDIALDLGRKTGYDVYYNYNHIINKKYNYFCFLGNDYLDFVNEKSITNLYCINYTLNKNNYNNIFTYLSDMYYNDIVYLDMTEIVVDLIYNDFYMIGK